MSVEEKRDMKFALKVLAATSLIMLGLGFWIGRASANELDDRLFQNEVIKKLDEISHKLDPKKSEPTSPTDILAQAITKNRQSKKNDSVGI